MKQEGSNFHQAFWLGLSQISSFILAFLSGAILSRYFTKEEYGTYRQIMFVFLTLQTVFTVGLPSVFTYFLPRYNSGQGKVLVNKITLFLGVLGFFFSASLFFGAELIAGLLKNNELVVGLKVFSVVPLLTLPTVGLEGIYTALRKTQQLAYYQIFGKIFTLACIVLPVILWQGSYLSALYGWVFASIVLFILAMYMKRLPYRKVTPIEIENFFKIVFSYSTPLMLASLVGILLHTSNQFFISRYYGEREFANFANGYITFPIVGMVAGAVKNVLIPIFSKAQLNNDVDKQMLLYYSAVMRSLTLTTPILVFSFFFSSDIMVFLYGIDYEISSYYFKASLIRDFFEVFPFLAVLLAFGKSNVYFYIHLVFAILIWVIDYGLVLLDAGPFAISYAYTFVNFLKLMTFFIYMYRVWKIHLLSISIIKHIVLLITNCILCLIFLQIFEPFMKELGLFFKLSINFSLFYLLIILSGRIFKIDYMEAVKKILRR